MKLTPPKTITFWISVALAILGWVGKLGILGAMVGGYAFVLVSIAFVLLALGLLVKGL